MSKKITKEKLIGSLLDMIEDIYTDTQVNRDINKYLQTQHNIYFDNPNTAKKYRFNITIILYEAIKTIESMLREDYFSNYIFKLSGIDEPDSENLYIYKSKYVEDVTVFKWDNPEYHGIDIVDIADEKYFAEYFKCKLAQDTGMLVNDIDSIIKTIKASVYYYHKHIKKYYEIFNNGSNISFSYYMNEIL